MALKIYRNRMVRRVLGTLTSLCFLALGAYALLGDDGAADAAAQDRAFWFGVTVTIAGVLGLAMSWLIREIDGVWCSLPNRWGKPR